MTKAVDYTERLRLAMKESGRDPDSPEAAHWLAKELSITYQAAKKALNGLGTGMFAANNNSLAARALGVQSDWLALGDVPMRATDPWPFPRVAPARWEACSVADQLFIQGAINESLRLCEEIRAREDAPQALSVAAAARRAALAASTSDPVDGAGDVGAQVAPDPAGGDSDRVIAK